MKRRLLARVKLSMSIVLLSSVLLSACGGPAPRDAQPLGYEQAECQFTVPNGYQIECGYLTVPENRQQTQGDSSTMRLHVATVKSRSQNPQPDPVVFLIGGPGGFALDYILVVTRLFDLVH